MPNKSASKPSRIHLARVQRSDAAALIAANLSNVDYHAPWVSPFTDLASFDQWYGKNLTAPNVSLLARRAEDGALVGVFNVSGIIMAAFQSGFLGYYGYAETAGQGLMSEALCAVLRYAFDELGLHRLEVNIQPENQRSIALVRRVGLRSEGFSPAYLKINGFWSDHERWAITSDMVIGTEIDSKGTL